MYPDEFDLGILKEVKLDLRLFLIENGVIIKEREFNLGQECFHLTLETFFSNSGIKYTIKISPKSYYDKLFDIADPDYREKILEFMREAVRAKLGLNRVWII